MNFKELISSCLQKNAQSQRELYDYLAPRLFGTCLKYAQNQDDAKDYFQESFILIFKNLHQFNFKPIEKGTYTFKFWNGKDNTGNDLWITKTIVVQ